MIPKRTPWLLLSIAAVLEVLLIASNLNDNSKLGPSGPLEIQLHGNLFTAASAAPIVLVAIAIFSTIFTPQGEVLLVAGLGGFIVGATLVHYTSSLQEQTWGLLVAFAVVVYAVRVLFESVVAKYVGFFRRREIPSSAPDTESISER